VPTALPGRIGAWRRDLGDRTMFSIEEQPSSAGDREMPEEILPDDVVGRLARAGMTDDEIVAHLRRNENVLVSREAISAWRRRRSSSDGAPSAPGGQTP